MRPDPDALRERLRAARLMLVFTPELCVERAPLDVLAAALPAVDAVQVRPKARGAVSEARAVHEWCLRALEVLAASGEIERVLLLANDRVDVAAALWEKGCAGCHVGQDDCPPGAARELLGAGPIVGLSTHDLRQVALAENEPVDYLGFGPFRPTATKGYERGVGSERAWVAHSTSSRPVFPIGGVDARSAGELSDVGRAAVGSAILAAADPAAAAREIRALLEDA